MGEEKLREKQNRYTPLVVLAGPTAVGKSDLSLRLAQTIGGEIISADSMQVYRGMDIGSAKLPKQDRGGIPHYLIDVLDPDEPFDVFRFKQMAQTAMARILENGHIPILVGGTGFYIQAVLYDIQFAPSDEGDGKRRASMEQQAAASPEYAHQMYEQLKNVDPQSAQIIHENNHKRVARALSFYQETGQRISEHNTEQRQRSSPYNAAYFVLTDDREKLYRRINERVDQMFQDGLEEEVRALYERGYTRDMVSMQGIGYKEVLDYCCGKCTLEEAVERVKLDTRHFAKRQLTWFRREKDVIWLDRQVLGSDERIMRQMLEILRQKEIYAGNDDKSDL